MGNLGGWVGPHAVGLIKDRAGASNVAAILLLGAALLGMGLGALALPKTAAKK